MSNIDPVILQLQADVQSYNANVAQAHRLTEQKLGAIEAKGAAMGQKLKQSFSLASAAAVAFAGSVVVDRVMQAVTAGLDYASSLGEVAQQLGISTDALQEYRYAASQAGLTQDEMDQSLVQLTRRIGDAANGSKAQADAFQRLGISVKDANGNMLDASTAIPMIADALQRIESPAARAAILMDLFGKSGQKLEPLLSGGSKAVNDLRDAAHKLGIVLSEDQIQRADDTADKLAAIKQVLSARIAGVVSDNAGAIITLANAFASLVDWASKAANAYRRFKLEQGLRLAENTANGWLSSDEDKAKANRDAAMYREELAKMDREGRPMWARGPISLRDTPQASRAPVVAASPSAGASSAAGSGGAVAGASGPSAAEIQSRLDSQLASYAQQALSAMESVAKSAGERAELELRSLELSRVRAVQEVKADEDYSSAQKERLIQQIDASADAERERIEFRKKADLEREAADLAAAENRAQNDALRDQYDLADSQAERKRIALEMVNLELRYQQSLLDAILASETASDADKRRAQIALDGLNASANARRAGASRANETPGEAYLRDLRKSPEAINESLDQIRIDGLESLNDGIVDAITGTKSLGDAFKNVANQIVADLIRIAVQQAIIKPLASALFGGGGGGGGFFGSLFGRASGGYVAPGQMVRVNEAASPGRVEAFMSRDGGTIVPLGQMNAMASAGQQGASGSATVRLELSGDIDARIQQVSGPVAVEIVKASAPAIVRSATENTMRQAGRPRI